MAKEKSNPTMKDVAQEAGVALGTVSKVINDANQELKSREMRAAAIRPKT